MKKKYGQLIFISALLTGFSANAQVSLNIEASRTSGVAPLYVFFDATTSSGLSEGNDLVNSDFSWNFDTQNMDPNGSWEITKGMVAGHVFEVPGSYEVTCTLTSPDGTVHTESINILVAAFGGTTYYVAADGDDDNDGLSEQSPWQSAEFAFQQLTANEQLLFRRGDIFFGLSQNFNNLNGGPVLIGAYGEGENPILSGDDSYVIDIRNSENIRVTNLHLIPTGNGVTGGLAVENSENILAYGLEIEQSTGRCLYQDESDLYGVFNCDLHDFGVLAIYSGDSRRFAFVGNSVNNLYGAPQPEHGMRIQGGEKQFVAHNSLTRLDDTKTAITIRGDGQQHVMVYKNQMDRILGVNPQNAQTVAAISNVVIEANYVGHNEDYIGNDFEPTINAINIEATRVAVRNNVIDGYTNAIFVGHDYNGVVSGMVDVYHNTVHWRPVTDISGTSGRIVRVRDVADVTISNNLISATAISNISVVNNDDGSTNITASDNLVTDTPGYIVSDLPGSAAHLNDPENYRIMETSPAVGFGSNSVPVFFDFNHNTRPNGAQVDVGAFEYVVANVVGVNQNGLKDRLTIYPNPFQQHITIDKIYSEGTAQLHIYDQAGKLCVEYELSNPSTTLDVTSLDNGLYLLVFDDIKRGQQHFFRLLKK